MRASTAIALCLSIALALPGPAPAAEEPAAAASVEAAARIATFGEWCRSKKLPRSAREQFDLALRLDPECAGARAGLGHVKGPGGWKPPARGDESNDTRMTGAEAVTEYARELEAAYREAGAAFAREASLITGEARSKEAAAAWRNVLRFDPAHARARSALRLDYADAGWLQADIPGPAATRARVLELAAKGSDRLPPPSAMETFELHEESVPPFSESSEDRFSVRSYMRNAGARDILDGILRGEAILEGLQVIPLRASKPARFRITVMESKRAFENAIRGRKDRNEEWKRRNLDFGGVWWETDSYLLWSWTESQVRECALHIASHHLVCENCGSDSVPPWLLEGTAHAVSTTVLGTAEIRCAAAGQSAVERKRGEEPDWDDAAREAIRTGRGPSLVAITNAGFNDFSDETVVRVRSLTTWLMVVYPKAVRRFGAAMANGQSPEDAFLRVLGAPPEAVERRWRCWALLP